MNMGSPSRRVHAHLVGTRTGDGPAFSLSPRGTSGERGYRYAGLPHTQEPNPTSRIRGGEGRKCLKINDRMFQVFTTEPVSSDDFRAVILGGGWAGNSSLSCCNNS